MEKADWESILKNLKRACPPVGDVEILETEPDRHYQHISVVTIQSELRTEKSLGVTIELFKLNGESKSQELGSLWYPQSSAEFQIECLPDFSAGRLVEFNNLQFSKHSDLKYSYEGHWMTSTTGRPTRTYKGVPPITNIADIFHVISLPDAETGLERWLQSIVERLDDTSPDERPWDNEPC